MARQFEDRVDNGFSYADGSRAAFVAGDPVNGAWLMIGRVLFGGFFLFNGIHHFMETSMLAAYAASKGVPSAEWAVMGSGLLLILGGASVLLGLWPRAGALLIMLFLAGVTPTIHDFWNATTPEMRVADFGNFTKNVALFGGACLAFALPAPWPVSVALRRRSTAAA